VAIHNYCFGPTILRVRPGQTVTWINKDTFSHSILGANGVWGGYEALRGRHNRVSYRFVRPGVYPYVCPYHVGMLGAVVAGNGRGLGAAHATTTKAGPVVLVPQRELVRSHTASIELGTSLRTATGMWAIRGGSALGLALVAIVALAARRRRSLRLS
jgi:hypothetical protein